MTSYVWKTQHFVNPEFEIVLGDLLLLGTLPDQSRE
jgi:hypothetical protein